MPKVLDAIAEQCYSVASGNAGDGSSALRLHTDAVLIGVGAPTRFFLPQAAALLGTGVNLPEHASTANALGAAVSNISVSVQMTIHPISEDLTTFYEEGYQVSGGGIPPQSFDDLDAAIQTARELSAQMAEAKVRSMGALGRIETATTVNKDYATAYSATMLVSVTVESRACVSSDDRS